jgi:hypothetical protein
MHRKFAALGVHKENLGDLGMHQVDSTKGAHIPHARMHCRGTENGDIGLDALRQLENEADDAFAGDNLESAMPERPHQKLSFHPLGIIK